MGEPFVGAARDNLSTRMIPVPCKLRARRGYNAHVIQVCRPPGNRDPEPTGGGLRALSTQKQIAGVSSRGVNSWPWAFAAHVLTAKRTPSTALRAISSTIEGIPVIGRPITLHTFARREAQAVRRGNDLQRGHGFCSSTWVRVRAARTETGARRGVGHEAHTGRQAVLADEGPMAMVPKPRVRPLAAEVGGRCGPHQGGMMPVVYVKGRAAQVVSEPEAAPGCGEGGFQGVLDHVPQHAHQRPSSVVQGSVSW